MSHVGHRSLVEQLGDLGLQILAAKVRSDDLARRAVDEEVGGDAVHGVVVTGLIVPTLDVAHVYPCHLLVGYGH